MDSRTLNLTCYLLGSALTALGLVKLAAVEPFSEALTALGAALLAVGRWDRIGMGDSRK